MKTLATLNNQVAVWKGIQEQIVTNLELLELANLENDSSFLDEIRLETDQIEKTLKRRNLPLPSQVNTTNLMPY